MEKIVIAIPNAKEKEIINTILSAYNNADNKDNLIFSVFSYNNEYINKNLSKLNNIKIIESKFYFDIPPGTGISRLIPHTLIGIDYDYLLQIDAHNLFIKGWDSYLKNTYNLINKKYKNFVISGYTNGFSKLENLNIYDLPEMISPGLKLNCKILDDQLIFFNEKEEVIWNNDEEYKESYTLQGAFIFGKKEFWEEFVHDPRNVWGGEQDILALRLITRDYKIFYPKKICMWSKNKEYFDLTKDEIKNNTAKTIKEKIVNQEEFDWRKDIINNDLWSELMMKTSDLRYNIYTGNYIGYWGSSSKKKLKEYEKKVGINFKKMYKKCKIGGLNG
jgi:hypothetical protein